ncbi:MAG: HDOD domain-containing protein [Gammaproteobacteria bacterium]|nr:HDOD domain-containing protein [Gammaproteobacteria bacterium]
MSKQETMKQITAKIERLGDLPVFSASVNHIHRISSDPDSDAMHLANEVLKDANLSTKLLRLSNSPYFNRFGGKINVISRAIILLGFDTVKNLTLTLKLIENFQHENPGIDMSKLLVRAYIAAGFVRDMAIKCGIEDAEETYTCALLHNLGEILTAYFLSDRYLEIQKLNREGNLGAVDNERTILGMTVSDVGKEVATSWDFAPRIVSTMESELPKIQGQITKPLELNQALAAIASKVVAGLYSDYAGKGPSQQELIMDMAKAAGLSVKQVEGSLTNSFKMSCELAQEYGLDKRKMMPVVVETGDDARDKLARQFAFFASATRDQVAQNPNGDIVETDDATLSDAATSITTPDAKTASKAEINAQLQLQYIQEITTLITDSAKLNNVLVKVLEGVHEAIGLNRVLLCLLSLDRSHYIGRIAVGHDKDMLKEYFNFPLNSKSDIFARIVLEGSEITVQDAADSQWKNALPPEFESKIAAKSFVASSLRSGSKPIGFIYADRGKGGKGITTDQQRGFIQFVAQARLALQTCR